MIPKEEITIPGKTPGNGPGCDLTPAIMPAANNGPEK